jgi:hypothetical protein
MCLLHYHVYEQLRVTSDKDLSFAYSLDLMRNAVGILEGYWDHLLIFGWQMHFTKNDLCRPCGIKKILKAATATGFQKYKDAFSKCIPEWGLKRLLQDTEYLESLDHLFTIRNLMAHGQPLRIELIPNAEHKTVFGAFLDEGQEGLIEYLRRKGVIPKVPKEEQWTWDTLLSRPVLLWVLKTVQGTVDHINNSTSFPLGAYGRDLKIKLINSSEVTNA